MKAVLMCIAVALASQALAQDADEDIQRFLDDYTAYDDAQVALEDLYETLIQTTSSPIDLNSATAEELRSLHLLNDVQIENFLAYRTAQGKLLDIYELQVVPGFDLQVLERIKPHVMIAYPRRLSHPGMRGADSYLLARYERTLQSKKGFTHTDSTRAAYQGSPDKLYFRWRTTLPRRLSIGFTGEKDAGEKMLFDRSRQWGFDFTSFHLQVLNRGKLKNLIAGDFQTQFGQGLVLGGAFGLGKGGETVLSTRKSSAGFVPYTSINEGGYQRGIAVTTEPAKDLLVSAFCSRARRDAAIDSAYRLTVTSLQASGYHRTRKEIENRAVQPETNYGLVVQWRRNGLDAGMMVNATRFEIPIMKAPTRYNQFTFRGATNTNTGLYLQYRVSNISFFSEVAQSLGAGRAVLTGILMTPARKLDLAFVFRNYAKTFYTFHSNAFAENTAPQNERGLYWGWKYQCTGAFALAGYVDMFSFPWLSFRRYSPASGYEWLLRAGYDPSRQVALRLQFREESKARNVANASPLYVTEEGKKRNVVFNCDYRGENNIRLKSRIQYSNYVMGGKRSQGFTIVQNVGMKLGRIRITASHALFDAEDSDNRQYVYENDAWMAFSFPAYTGTGVRNYVLIEYRLLKNITLWMRFAATRLRKGDGIGSAQEAIEGNTRNDVKFQARYSF